MKDYYKILEINPNASNEIIKAAYKALVKKYHPDNTIQLYTDKTLTDINEAYDILSNKESKYEYDLKYFSSFSSKKERPDSTQKYDFSEMRKNRQTPTKNYNNETEIGNESKINISKPIIEDDTQCDKEASGIFEGKAWNFVKKVGLGIVNEMNKQKEKSNEAREIGQRLNDRELIRRYHNSSGGTKHGYAKVLEERGFLEHNNEGRLVPTDKFKYFK